MENPITNPFIVRGKKSCYKSQNYYGRGPDHAQCPVSTRAPCLPKHFTTVDPVSRPFFPHNYCSLILSAGVSSLTVHHASLPH